MKLFLTSTGLIPETRAYFLDLLAKKPAEYNLAFIPTAADPEVDKWFVEADLKELKEIGFKINIVDLKDDPKIIHTNLTKSQIIYVGGGNTFYLLHWIRKSGVDKYLKELLEDGRYYVGASAGSILAGPDISVSGWDPTWDSNDIKITDTSSLNLTHLAISPHYTEKEEKVIIDKSKNFPYEVFPLTDKQAILVDNKNYCLVGVGGPSFAYTAIRNLVKTIPKGKVMTYGDVGKILNLKSARVVGWALKGNQDPLIPCHRVVQKAGFLAQNYSLGTWIEQKRRLVVDGVTFIKDNQVDMTRHHQPFVLHS
ncbi:MAG: methylated-DNA--[protein]-cysteine S-methyltransferase [Candidatus Shapirobacteria bacterium]|jgi:dipeptidase E